jgi:hypothetical protein
MATIIIRKSDNMVTHFALEANFSKGYLSFTDVNNETVESPSVKPDAYEIVNDVTLPKKWFADCFKYEDGAYTILEDQVAMHNEGRKVMRDKFNAITAGQGDEEFPDIEVEI